MKTPLALLMLPLILAACGSTPPTTETNASAEATAGASARSMNQQRSELDDTASPLSKRSVFFPLDSFLVDAKYDEMLNAHAGYLKRNPSARISLEGNADEQGSSEYNLALGQKRADIVRKSLSLRGVEQRQMEAISYGKEKPKANCHDESCWEQNRRTDIVYPATH